MKRQFPKNWTHVAAFNVILIALTMVFFGSFQEQMKTSGISSLEGVPCQNWTEISSDIFYSDFILEWDDPDRQEFCLHVPGYFPYIIGYYHDFDGDGIGNHLEFFVYQSIPFDGDTDNDGYSDSYEISRGWNPFSNEGLDLDGDGLSNIDEITNGTLPRDADPDHDGLNDYLELLHGSDPFNRDTDGDGLDDQREVNMGIDPVNPDSDGDTMGDYWEFQHGLNPGVDDGLWDLDGDQLSNIDEYNRGTLPNDKDTDDDGLDDYQEIMLHGTDPLITDTDGDLFSDLEEVNAGTDPRSVLSNPAMTVVYVILIIAGIIIVLTFIRSKVKQSSKKKRITAQIIKKKKKEKEEEARRQEQKEAELEEARRLAALPVSERIEGKIPSSRTLPPRTPPAPDRAGGGNANDQGPGRQDHGRDGHHDHPRPEQENENRIVVSPKTVRENIKQMWKQERDKDAAADPYGRDAKVDVFEFHYSNLRDRMGIKDGSKKDTTLFYILYDFCFEDKILVKKEKGVYRTTLNYNQF